MKNLLAALFIASAAITAGACTDPGPNPIAPEQSFEAPEGFEVVVLEPSGSLEDADDRPSYSSSADTLRVHQDRNVSAEARRDRFSEGVAQVRQPDDDTRANDGEAIADESVEEIATPEASQVSNETPSRETPDDPCDCVGASCEQDWVAQNLGCNVCVAFSCADNARHACNRC